MEKQITKNIQERKISKNGRTMKIEKNIIIKKVKFSMNNKGRKWFKVGEYNSKLAINNISENFEIGKEYEFFARTEKINSAGWFTVEIFPISEEEFEEEIEKQEKKKEEREAKYQEERRVRYIQKQKELFSRWEEWTTEKAKEGKKYNNGFSVLNEILEKVNIENGKERIERIEKILKENLHKQIQKPNSYRYLGEEDKDWLNFMEPEKCDGMEANEI